jgi:hypothetical protein
MKDKLKTTTKIERIEGNKEIIGFYINGVKIKERKRRIFRNHIN